MSSLRVCEYEAGAAAPRDGGTLGQRVEEGVLRGDEAPPSPRHAVRGRRRRRRHFGPLSLSVWRSTIHRAPFRSASIWLHVT